MAASVKLTQRQQRILWATIRHYIETAEPVGSKALGAEYNLNVSPATIRSGMGALERAGLLYQPHTSAGRVPSDSGYRIYVDQLMTPSGSSAEAVNQLLRSHLKLGKCSIEAIVRGAAQILATLSGYLTLITIPQTQATCLRHLQLISIEPGKVMLMVVTDTYQTQSVVMELPTHTGNSAHSEFGSETLPESEELIEQELQVLSNFLNRHLRGRALTEFSTLDWNELDREFQCYANLLCRLLTDLESQGQPPEYGRIQFSGVSEVLRLPEFSQVQQTQTIIHLIEDEPEQLWPLISPVGKQGQVKVRIGSENPLEPIQSCTLISAQYYQETQPAGSVSVLGPTRMKYESAIALVEATANYLSEALGSILD
ncbi:MAG: heat-inducible transcriptional repressor HrcA [Microcoleaceae cyanobacterium]